MQADNDEATKHRDENSVACAAATKALDDAQDALQSANKSKEEAARNPADEERKSNRKRGADDCSFEQTLGVQLSQTLTAGLKEKADGAAMDTDSNEPPLDQLLQIVQSTWSAVIAERQASSASKDGDGDRTKVMRTG